MSRKVFNAKVSLLRTKEGGRTAALRSGYRSLLRFAQSELDFGFELELEDGPTATLAPGESANARLSIWAADDLPIDLQGRSFEIREGLRVVGSGNVSRD